VSQSAPIEGKEENQCLSPLFTRGRRRHLPVPLTQKEEERLDARTVKEEKKETGLRSELEGESFLPSIARKGGGKARRRS